MPRAAQGDHAGVAHLRPHGVHVAAQLAAGENQVEVDQDIVIPGDILLKARRLGGERHEDAVDLLLLFRFQLFQFVVRLHHAHRLDEDGRAAGRRVVDKAGQLAAELGLHRHDEAPAALGDDRLLQDALVAGGRDDLLQDLPPLCRRRALVAADVGKLRTGGVGDLILADDGGGDLFL